MNTMSRGSRMVARNRTMDSPPAIPIPAAMLPPIASISVQVTTAPSAMLCTKLRE